MRVKKTGQLWNLDFTKDKGLHAPAEIAIEYRKKFKCKICGILGQSAKPVFRPLPIVGLEPKGDMSTVWEVPVSIWSAKLFDEISPYMPPVVRWTIEPLEAGWTKKWVAFSVPPTSMVRGQFTGHTWRKCPVCGEFRNTGMIGGGKLWFRRKDVKYGWFRGDPYGMYVTDEVKSLQIWETVRDKKFAKSEVRDE